MTAVRALRFPRLKSPRPLALLVAALAIVVASQVVTFLQGSPAQRIASPADRPTINAPVSPPEAPVPNAPDDLARIDHNISAWTRNLAANDKDFLSASNLGLLYEARARLSGDVADYGRANAAAERSLGIVPTQLDVLALHARLAFATHDFTRALSEASSLDRTAPDQP